MKTIGIFVGSLSNPNVQRVVRNHGWMLGEQFKLDLVTTNSDQYHTKFYDDIVGDSFPSTRLGSIRALEYYLSEYTPDVLYHTNRQIHALLITSFGKIAGVKTVYRYPGDTFRLYRVAEGWKSIPYFGLNNILGRPPLYLADKAVVLGPHGRNQLVDRGMDKSDVSILPPTIDIDSFQDTDSISLDTPSGRKIVLFLGRRTHLKGIKTMEVAIPDILRRRSDLQFVFVGKGRGIKANGESSDHITVEGRVPPSSVPAYLQAADVVVLPSLIEGVPRVLLESLVTQTPVIARNTGDISTVTRNTFQDTGEFIDLVCDFERLPVDRVDEFDRKLLRNRYVSFFNSIVSEA